MGRFHKFTCLRTYSRLLKMLQCTDRLQSAAIIPEDGKLADEDFLTGGRRKPEPPKQPQLPRMKRRDFTLQDLKKYNGVDDERILIAVNGQVFDVTRGKNFYGPDGP
ncbi:Membrane-associated progesterone receptor component 1 [Holothuria leucospilota]|uniref:Membrane-associated progesterone receptor component 1 n=1 Tax=Holothuria leucospilota TaxID=206669 RepID=A0A9Q1BKN9_HOLLE|nr:Membrane-associated progesterone receptor component 1 [Holothuria leucospilota]